MTITLTCSYLQQVHPYTTTLIAEERAKLKEKHLMSMQVIEQVEVEYRARGYGVNMGKTTIN